MKKDIERPKVEDIAVAVIKDKALEEAEWGVYILNLKDEPIENVLVSSKGYGNKNGEKVFTSVLRHFIDRVEAKSFSKIEPIQSDLFGLHNEYMVSFYIGKTIYDKKYVFVAESIIEGNLVQIPLMDKMGVMIQ
ncbi:MAG: hypothetical protein MRY83_21285 [Flavobacteriales bacterium]|nr:hypothetical protein [Flavobacteriales bacterium]